MGRSTAAAVAVFAFGERAAILDGNVKRLLCRVFAVDGPPGEAAVMRSLWAHAQAELPATGIESYTQGLMDLGATLCTRGSPACERCPLQAKCLALRANAVARYPAPKPRGAMPVREVDMLLLCKGESVLIEQRPPVGIWGGLWSLPEVRIEEGAATVPAAGLSLAAARPTQFMRFEHVFTHFRMKARVWRAELDDIEAATVLRQAPVTRWLALADAAASAPAAADQDAAAVPGCRRGARRPALTARIANESAAQALPAEEQNPATRPPPHGSLAERSQRFGTCADE